MSVRKERKGSGETPDYQDLRERRAPLAWKVPKARMDPKESRDPRE